MSKREPNPIRYDSFTTHGWDGHGNRWTYGRRVGPFWLVTRYKNGRRTGWRLRRWV